MWRKASIVAVLLLITSIAIVQPALAQNINTTWRGDFFNNPNLQGTPAFSRNDSNIAFNWGTGSPGDGVGNDNFSVRWATDVQLSAGTYRFYAQADDNIRIIFNFGFQPVIDTFATGEVNQLVTGDVTVPAAGVYHIQVDYRELTDQAFAFVSFANIASGPTGPNFPAPIPVPTGAWTAQYFPNTGLAGDPVTIQTESSPNHNWGTGAPLPSMPADNFSVRWTSTQNLPGGTYNISTSADDGVRVWVNNSLVIDQWGSASGQTYSVNLNLPAGLNTFRVEFVEFTGAAYINFSLSQVGSVQPTQPPATSSTATVTAFRLNVRAEPSASAQILTRINRNETYPVLARTADSRWYQITVGGAQGWVSAGYVNVSNPGTVPIIGSAPQPAPTGQPQPGDNTVTTNGVNVVIRNGPGTQFARIGLLSVDGVAQLIGRNSNNTWWQVNFNGVVGWVTAQYTTVHTSNINAIPVTG